MKCSLPRENDGGFLVHCDYLVNGFTPHEPDSSGCNRAVLASCGAVERKDEVESSFVKKPFIY